ncbi:MAG: hypothetical protein AB9919_06835 [Geobacteraceae bacterium]
MSDTSQLATAEYNPRKISKERLALLRTQLAEFGDLSGIVFNNRTARLVGGHQRISALEASWPIVKENYRDETGTVAVGHIDTPFGRFSYREVDWDEHKEKLANLAANNPAGEFDNDLLKPMLLELDASDLDIKLSGLPEAKIEKFLLPPDPPQVKDWELGDLYEPFWLVIRGPISELYKVRSAIGNSGAVDLTVEGGEV